MIDFIKRQIIANRSSNIRQKLSNAPCCDIHNSFIVGKYFSLETFSKDFKVIIHSGVLMRNYCQILLYPESELLIRDNVFFNNYCSINCLGRIEIGSNTIIGEGVKLYDHNHKYEKVNEKLEVSRNDFNIGKIQIGKNCWIGSNVTILKGVEIGNNVIIGANCHIYKSIPENSIVKSKFDISIQTL